MADNTNPNGTNRKTYDFLPRIYKSDSNKKFLQATLDQLVQPGTVNKINGFIGRQNSKATTGDDIFIKAANKTRQDYQLEPGITVNDELGKVSFFKDYQDYINQLGVFGANTTNHSKVNEQELYSWDPHIDWDKFVNFQQYYWLPYGPDIIEVSGQPEEVVSEYTVTIESQLENNAFIFSPDGLTRNPVIKLYKGQTYKFNINSPVNPFSIKTARTTGARNRYANGITNNGIESGVITFTVPYDAPDVLFYVSETDVDCGGVIKTASILQNTYINIEAEILGKRNYTLRNGTPLSNGMKLSFAGDVEPAKYGLGNWYVEGVGDAITLISETDLELVSAYTTSESILFDETPFDVWPFSDAATYAKTSDYIVINRGSRDRNPWSRYNRWFHKDVIEGSAAYNGKIADIDQSQRAVRPIIEFEANLKLFNFGTAAIANVALVDTDTTDVFSRVEGSYGYSVDGVSLSDGMRVLFTADTDTLVKNKIYKVSFVDPQRTVTAGVSSRQIHLVLDEDPLDNQVVLVNQGILNQGKMYWYDGSSWIQTQQKSTVNQPPLFEVVDEQGVNYANTDTYIGSSFRGTKLFSYKVGTGTADSNLGFALSYKNISNIGDIVFTFNLAIDTFTYKDEFHLVDKNIASGFLLKTLSRDTVQFVNGWRTCARKSTQAAVRIYKNSGLVNNFDLDIFDNVDDLSDLEVKVYVNGTRLNKDAWALVDESVYKQIALVNDISANDILTIRAFAAQPINSNGHYEIPVNLQNNPLNNLINEFTLGEVIDHVGSIVDNLPAFEGSFPGKTNLRDLGNVANYGTKFVQHSGPASLSMYHITSKQGNVIKAIEASQRDYNKFKRSFLKVSETLGVDTNVVDHLDLVLTAINKDIPKTSPYYFTDMVSYGARLVNKFPVLDSRIKKYPLTDNFTLETLSSKAVYVYYNGTHLIHGVEYIFDGLGYVELLIDLVEDDVVTIYEYDTTDGCFIPATPTKLGIWPAFQPKIYTDTSLVTPRLMIQGHDGSQVLAYGDYRDNLILELEQRIYNNLKVKYDPAIFDMHEIIPGYSRTTPYSLSEFNEVMSPQFYKWTSLIDADFTKPLSFDRENSFTFNHRGLSAPDGRALPGYWRGIYRWLYDTDRPHSHPWEMLGITEQPIWWENTYGPAPYTKDNLLLWNDLADGLLRDPVSGTRRLENFVRPFLLDCIPVDESGALLSPSMSSAASGILTTATRGDFIFGDVSPIEGAWRRSSYYPFATIITLLLLQPSKVFGALLDRSRVVRNPTGQLVYKDTGLRVTPKDIVFPSIYSSKTRTYTSGIVNYIVDYIVAENLKFLDTYKYDMANINCQLSYRLGAFTSKEKFKLLLDSKSPTTSSVFVPPEDYNIILNISSPVKKITYSGVIITKLSDGFDVRGYSKTQPYFKYYPWNQAGLVINVGGISESFSEWTVGEQYAAGKVVFYKNKYYRVKVLHTANTFDASKYQSLPSLPIVGGKDAYIRSAWDKDETITVPYGTKFRTIQDTVDFLLGYGEYLKDQGFIFDDFNNNLGLVTNWETSAKEFLFWTTQNWSTGQDKWSDWNANQPIEYEAIVRYNGDYYKSIVKTDGDAIFINDNFVKLDGLSTVGSSVLSLSPSASKITFANSLTVVDSLEDQFNDYEIFKVDGTPITPDFLNSYRSDNSVSYSSQGTDGIFGASFYLIQKEQVIILNNSTMFNDTIFNPESGYKQDRIKVAGYVTTDWRGAFDAPGFVFDQATINDWAAWQDYALGDVVKYKEFYYTSNASIVGKEKFEATDWSKLESAPTPKLLPNWTYKAAQFTDFYNLDSDNFDAGQQKMAQHLIGYQQRQYLANIIKDDVSEFKFYQGMIIEKGTQNSLNKLFDVLSAEGQESIKFYEEWALRVGQYGASSAFENIEFVLDETVFKGNPQSFELVNTIDNSKLDFVIRQTPTDVYVKPLGYNNEPWPLIEYYQPFLRSPGYVRLDDAKLVLNNITEVVGKSNDGYVNGDYIWCGFEGPSWNVYRYTSSGLEILDVTYNSATKELTIIANSLITLDAGSYIAIAQVDKFSGFYKIKSVELNTFVVDAYVPTWVSPFTEQLSILIFALTTQRAPSINDANSVLPTTIKENELLWTDDAGNGKWAVWKYNSIFTSNTIINNTPETELGFGRNINMNHAGTIMGVATTKGELVIYDKPVNPQAGWVRRETINKPAIANDVAFSNPNSDFVISEFLAMSEDGLWLAAASPLAGYAASRYKGIYNQNVVYPAGDVVRHGNGIWTALFEVPAYQLPNQDSIYWEKTRLSKVDITGENSNLASQGAVSLYQKDSNNIYTLIATLISPAPTANERFGSSVVFGNNRLFVGANGNSGNTGIVYQLDYATRVETSAYYNPNGSSGNILITSKNTRIKTGMTVRGIGYTSGQVVGTVINTIRITVIAGNFEIGKTYTILSKGSTTSTQWNEAGAASADAGTVFVAAGVGVGSGTVYYDEPLPYTKLILSQVADDIPDGIIEFTTTAWGFSEDNLTIASPGVAGERFGSYMSYGLQSNRLLVSASSVLNNGKVFAYTVGDGGATTLLQTITGPDALFGQSISMSNSGRFIALGSVLADGTETDQGAVSIYEWIDTAYVLSQVIVSRSPESAAYFGSKVSFMNDYDTLVVYSQNADRASDVTFDAGNTTFDDAVTAFKKRLADNGEIDIFDRYSTKWVYSETLQNPTVAGQGYGLGFAIAGNHIVIGAPYAVDANLISGKVYEYRKPPNKRSWNIIHREINKPDLTKIKKAFLYNKQNNTIVSYLDVIDPAQGKIPGTAEQELRFKTYYDPAIYSVGTDTVNVDDGQAWAKDKVGMLWWDLRTAKFLDCYDDELVYRNTNWNSLFPSASIDIYEWVETTLLPEAWNALADTEEGLTKGISGLTLYDNTVYSSVKRYDTISKVYKNTYYYWVKNKKTVPNIVDRKISANQVANLISNPRGQGYQYLALNSANSFSLVNIQSLINDKDVVLSVEYWTSDYNNQNVHSQWKIISNNQNTILPQSIESKWFDSLCGKDQDGRPVPDMLQPPKLRYGVENRPRQSMFINRFEALKQFIERANLVLINNQIAEDRDISALSSYESAPLLTSGLYDDAFDTDAELRFANISSYIRPNIKPIIVDGTITGATIIESGIGYITPPTITVAGLGKGASLKSIINTKGQITGVIVVSGGKGYTNTTALLVRDYSVLVRSDSLADGTWSICSYEPTTQTWSRVQSQSYDVRKYWSYADWYATGYTQFSAVDYSVATFADINTIDVSIGETVKVRSSNSGNWMILEKYADSSSIDWTQSYKVVGNQNGTIQISSSLYQFNDTTYGFDGSLYDNSIYDNIASYELRIILNTIKDNILIDNLRSDYLTLFFTCIRYALSEQSYLDWIFKTSFVKAQHVVGGLKQPATYNSDNLESFESYINEVKPYRTKVREYVSSYNADDTSVSSVTDFDLPAVYDKDGSSPVITSIVDGIIQSNNILVDSYPWKHWKDNLGFSITELRIVDGGSGYVFAPSVIINSSTGSGATAKAYISNGKVTRVVLLTPGSGYLSTPTISLNGGVGSTGGTTAKIVASIGDSVIRSNLIKMKFDRTTQTYFITQLQEVESFTGNGSRLQWPLKWAPDTRIGKSSITVNGVEVLRDSYKLVSVKSTTKGYTSYTGSIQFQTAIPKDSPVTVTYIKDWALLNAADRIQYYYNPVSGQLGKDLAQLMTGVDYGGVIVSGLSFDISGGWDSQPYFTDKWDSSDSSFDDYIVTVQADTHSFTLPYTPTSGTEINIYHSIRNVDSHPADGGTKVFSFNTLDLAPEVSVVRPVQTTGTTVAYTMASNAPITTTITVADTTNIDRGMTVLGTGFNSGQTVSQVVNSTTLILSAPPNTRPSGNLFFTRNVEGTNILTISSTAGIKVNDVVSSPLTKTINSTVYSAFGYGTKVSRIINSTQVQLDQILYVTAYPNAEIIFTRNLVTPTDCIIYGNGTVTLTEAPLLGSTVVIASLLAPMRIDDTNFGTPTQTNANAIMVPYIANGTNNVVTIPSTLVVNDGDRFILRKSTSDGSIVPRTQDYDTAISGGDLAYSTASGLTPDEIILDGDGFVTETTSPATEEVVPGQVVDAVAIKVFDKPSNGSANIKVDNYLADGSTTRFTMSQTINSKQAVIVKIDNQIKYETDDYTVEYKTNTVEFITPPPAGAVVSLFGFGFAGSNILDLDYFVGNGLTNEFITKAPWVTNLTGLVYINGEETVVELFKTDARYAIANRVGLRFTYTPAENALINFVIVSGTDRSFSIAKSETIITDGSVTYDLTNNYGDALPIESNIIVKAGDGANSSILPAPSNSYFTIKNNRLTYTIDYNKFQPYTVSILDIFIFAGGNLLTPGADYVLDLAGISVKINKATYKTYSGKTLVVSIRKNGGYVFTPKSTTPATITLASPLPIDTRLEITSFYNHDILDVQRTSLTVTTNVELTPDTLEYFNYRGLTGGRLQLERPVINDYYVMITKNGKLLTPGQDFVLNDDKQSIRLAVNPEVDDTFDIATYGSKVLTSGIAYMQFKDMLNRVHFKRLSVNKQTVLSADLYPTDTTIEVDDASNFDIPNPSNNKPGVIEIRGERIEYFTITGNILGQLRRGTLGTSTPSIHLAGSRVQDIGPSETIPYEETIQTEQVTSTGSTTISLESIPGGFTTDWKYKGVNLTSTEVSSLAKNAVEVFVGGYDTSVEWAPNTVFQTGIIVTVGTYTYRTTNKFRTGLTFDSKVTTLDDNNNVVATNVNASSVWAFFVGNIRLKKLPYQVHNVNQAPDSPEGDIDFPADFTVTGVSKSLELTTPVTFGTRVSVITRKGQAWDSSVNITADDSKIAKFLKATPGIWYSEVKKT